ncbi:hypothetical protein [Brevibacillus centrosporus]|uniref:hypothetical protein n=1 Tax=Brevibacillus centrosporus TaxID=54910 RepID=UPI003B02046A
MFPLKAFFSLLVLSSLFGQTSEGISRKAQVIRAHPDLVHESGIWWKVPKGRKMMTIYVEAKNTETVLFWLIPTGTQTWKDRELIGYDKDGSDGWSLTWYFGDRTFHDHIHVQAIGEDSVSSDMFNVSSD